MFRAIRPAIVCLLFFTLLCGVAYPLFVTAITQTIFPHQAEGSLIDNRGSELIGQNFTKPQYFWGRLSAASYNAAASTGSNLAASNPALLDAVKARIAALKAVDPTNTKPIPVDLVTASGSGLDPHISPAAAEYQIVRVAKTRGKTEQEIRVLVTRFTEGRQFGILGEPRVNVLKLNLALDGGQNEQSKLSNLR